jgi:hypothetical protein
MDAPAVETTRQRTPRVGAQPERAALALPQSPAVAPGTGAIALGIDVGHLRPVHSHQVRSSEVLVARVGGTEDKPVVFASVPAEGDRQK